MDTVHDRWRLKVESARTAKGWSKAQLSRTAGINQTTAMNILNGRLVPNAADKAAIEEALGL